MPTLFNYIPNKNDFIVISGAELAEAAAEQILSF